MVKPNTRIQLGILALLVTAAFALAQNDPPPPPAPPAPQQSAAAVADDGGPGRGVARLSLVDGDVSLRRGDAGEVVAGSMNSAIMFGDAVITGQQSRSEIQFDYSNMIRLGALSDVRLSELEFHRYMLQIASGTVTFRVMRNNDASIELGTPSVALRPAHRGTYRVAVRPDGTTEIIVREGDIDVYTQKGSEHLRAGQAMIVRGDTDPEYQIYNAPAEDDWDRWNMGRDQFIEQHASSIQYINPDVYGAEDLDGNGRWVNNPTYGEVWSPTVNPDWAPYQNGRWVWEDYYGWTWVSYDTWGWAPYHYGRWFYEGGVGWCWWPGARIGHAYWRPALVGFFGFGGVGVGVGFGFGNIGWVPLAPYESFHPWWGRGIYGGYRTGAVIGTAAIARNINVANVYRNARVEGAVTAMNGSQFGRAAVNRTTMVRASRGDIQNAGLVRGQLPVAPNRASLSASDRMPRAGTSSVSTGGHFFQTRQPTAVNRVPFEQQARTQQQAYHTPGGGGGSGGAWHPSTPSGGIGGAASAQPHSSIPVNTAAGAGGGWRRFEPGGGGAYPSQASGAGAYNSARQPLRMNPSIVQPRPTYQQPSGQTTGYSQPSSYRPAGSTPASSGGGSSSRPSSGSTSSGGGHPSSGGASRGGGGHSGGHGR